MFTHNVTHISSEAGGQGGQGGQAPAFTPTDISGLIWWLDASDSNTVTTSSGKVSLWEDKSTSNFDVSQASASIQPTYASAAVNSLNAILFGSGANTYMSCNAALGSTQSIFIVFQEHPSAQSFNIPIGGNSVYFGKADNGWNMTCGGGDAYVYSSWNTDTKMNTFFRSGSTSSSRMNSVDLTASTNTLSANNFTATLLGNYVNAFYAKMYMCEIIVYNTSLGTSDRDDVETYISDKWGIV